MGWNDRDYNPGREEMRSYMANPAAALSFALPLYKSAGLQIHLGFWFLLSALFLVIFDLQTGGARFIPTDLLIYLGLCLWHEFGHRVMARRVGGNHWEWVLSPFGGMVTPTAPNSPWPTFLANIGGIVFSAGLQLFMVLAALAVGGTVNVSSILFLPIIPTPVFPWNSALLAHSMMILTLINMIIILINLFPSFVLDGGRIWTAILWPKLGQWRATGFVCLAGMILAVPLFLLSIWSLSFLGMVFWALIFAGNFRLRQQLAAAGPGVMDDEGPSYNYMDTDPHPKKRGKKSLKSRWVGSSLRKKARAEQAEQAKIDEILAKVKEKGLHSLSWWEKRTLRKATERQRQQDLAERL